MDSFDHLKNIDIVASKTLLEDQISVKEIGIGFEISKLDKAAILTREEADFVCNCLEILLNELSHPDNKTDD